MVVFIILIMVGVLFVILGTGIMRGNINLIHSYHVQKVSEEDKPVFGKRMGLGTIVCGAGIISFGILAILAELTAHPLLMTVGSCLLIPGLALGIGILIHTTVRYNKSIF